MPARGRERDSSVKYIRGQEKRRTPMQIKRGTLRWRLMVAREAIMRGFNRAGPIGHLSIMRRCEP